MVMQGDLVSVLPDLLFELFEVRVSLVCEQRVDALKRVLRFAPPAYTC